MKIDYLKKKDRYHIILEDCLSFDLMLDSYDEKIIKDLIYKLENDIIGLTYNGEDISVEDAKSIVEESMSNCLFCIKK